MTIVELKALAEAATPGAWNMKRAERDLMLAWHVEGEREELIGAQYKSDAAFIAAANPHVVAAMIEFITQSDLWEAGKNSLYDVGSARAAIAAIRKESDNG